MGGTFTIWMAQPRILETQVTPPPGDNKHVQGFHRNFTKIPFQHFQIIALYTCFQSKKEIPYSELRGSLENIPR